MVAPSFKFYLNKCRDEIPMGGEGAVCGGVKCSWGAKLEIFHQWLPKYLEL